MARKNAEIMSIDQLAEYLDISRSTLYKLAQDGKLPGQKVGRRFPGRANCRHAVETIELVPLPGASASQ